MAHHTRLRHRARVRNAGRLAWFCLIRVKVRIRTKLNPNPNPNPNQAALTWFYLVKRAEYLTSNLMDSCRDELLKLWEREGLVRLVRVRVRVEI